ncbi:MAG: mercuric transporter MerT family protein, partial [Gemmatimonadales bacterium]
IHEDAGHGGDVIKTMLAAIGGVSAALVSALCCAGPLIAVTLGVSGAGLSATFEPLRPYFLAGTALFLGFGFFLVQREEQKACEPGKPCAQPEVRRRMRIMLWIATGIAILFATYPRWQTLIL